MYLTCPICDCEIPLSGDEAPGEELICPYCQSPLRIRGDDMEGPRLEEDY